MKPGPAIAEVEEPRERRIGPSQFERCKHPGCQREVRFAFAGGYCLKHHIQHREESEIMDKKISDQAIRDAVAKHPDNLKAARLELGMSDTGFAYRARKLGLMAPPKAQGKKRRQVAPKAPPVYSSPTAVAQAPPKRPGAAPQPTRTAPAPTPTGSDSVLDQVEGVISAAQQIVAALRPLGDTARHQVLMLVGGAGVGLPARGEG